MGFVDDIEFIYWNIQKIKEFRNSKMLEIVNKIK